MEALDSDFSGNSYQVYEFQDTQETQKKSLILVVKVDLKPEITDIQPSVLYKLRALDENKYFSFKKIYDGYFELL